MLQCDIGASAAPVIVAAAATAANGVSLAQHPQLHCDSFSLSHPFACVSGAPRREACLGMHRADQW